MKTIHARQTIVLYISRLVQKDAAAALRDARLQYPTKRPDSAHLVAIARIALFSFLEKRCVDWTLRAIYRSPPLFAQKWRDPRGGRGSWQLQAAFLAAAAQIHSTTPLE